MFFQAFWEWVLAPPLRWVLALSAEWQLELCILLVVVFLWRPIIEHSFITVDEVRSWRKEKQRIREWYYYASMKERDLRADVSAIRRQADQQDLLARRLDQHSRAGLTGEVLRKAAMQRRAAAEALRNEAGRLERLWHAIEKERGGPGDKAGMRAKVLRLMRQLESTDQRAASNALAELNRIGSGFDWDSLVPSEMTPAQRRRLVQLLRLMAGTNSLGEALNAYASALQMLQDIDQEWEWMMA
jgi:hypothetical protein